MGGLSCCHKEMAVVMYFCCSMKCANTTGLPVTRQL